MSQSQFHTWVKPLEFIRCDDRQVVLGAPNSFHQEWVRTYHSHQIRKAISEQCGADLQLEFEILVRDENREASRAGLLDGPLLGAPPETPPQAPGSTLSSGSAYPGRPNLRIVGNAPSGSTASDSARASAQAPSALPESESSGLPVFTTPFLEMDFNRVAYQFAGLFTQGKQARFNPLIIHGGVGMGKTHLLAEIGRWLQAGNPRLRVRYLNAQSFGNEYVRALRAQDLHSFNARYAHETDCLLFDDIHALSGPKFQETLLFIFNEITNRGGRIAFSTSLPPHRLPDLIEPLRSRLASGVVAEIRYPTHEERVALLARMCEKNQIVMDPTALRCLADKGQKDVRELLGSLLRVHLQATMENREVDAQFLSREGSMVEPAKEPITMGEIVSLVEHNFGVSRDELMSKSRKEGPTWARQVAMYLARTYTLLPLAEIGKTFGRDHATVLHAFDKVQSTMESHPQKRYQVEFLTKKLQARSPAKGIDVPIL